MSPTTQLQSSKNFLRYRGVCLTLRSSAMSSGGRCGNGCGQSSLYPAVVYFPSGYVERSFLVPLRVSCAQNVSRVDSRHQLLVHCDDRFVGFNIRRRINSWPPTGDGRNWPVIKAAANFSGEAVIDAGERIISCPIILHANAVSDPYTGSGQYYVNQNNFYRSLRNFVLDMTALPVTSTLNGIHWQVSQATTISGFKILMSTASNTGQTGIWMVSELECLPCPQPAC